MRRLGTIWFLAWAIPLCLAQPPARDDFIRLDPQQVMLPEACGECHHSEFGVWKQTPHANGYDELHVKESALEIAQAMGFRLIKRESLCLKCHYTSIERRGNFRAAAGVSCESCHGAGRDWINVHNVYGVREPDFQKARTLETPEHKQQRLATMESAGMLRPSNIYAVASNCFQCHTVPHEKLVNVGRHSTGSSDFEVVEWSERIRHNFLESFLTADGTENAPRTPQRKRVLYFIGRALDLEYSLRGLAAAGEEGRYFKAMKRRARKAIGEMREISESAGLPEATQLLAATRGVPLDRGNSPALLAAADAISRTARNFAAQHDGSRLAALDPFYAGTRQYRAEADSPQSEPETVEASVDEPTGGEATDPGQAPGAAVTPVAAGEDPVTATTETVDLGKSDRPRPRPTVSSVGRIRNRPDWRPPLQHARIGPDKCASCHRHADQSDWWFDDPHYASADRFLEGDRKALQIARFYGLGPRDMKRGDRICMQCHGSVVSGRESRVVDTGVGCESCHGPGADFREPHQEENGGYQKALTLGMVELKSHRVRAQTCAGCHYINDPRLLSAGHPSGSGFNLAERNAEIQHWEGAPGAAAPLLAAYQQVVASRGPVPSVEVLAVVVEVAEAATDPGPVSRPVAPVATVARGPDATAPQAEVEQTPSAPRRTVEARTGETRTTPPARGLGLKVQPLEGFPPIDENTTFPELLRLIQQRLQELYRRTPNRRP